MFTLGQLSEITAGARPLGAMKTVTFDGGASTGSLPAKAAFTTALSGANNDMTYTADANGLAGNDLSIEYRDPAEGGQVLSADLDNKAIIVNLATTTLTAATKVLTSDQSNPTDADTVTLDGRVYQFLATPLAAYDVQITPYVAATGLVTSDNVQPATTGNIVVDDQTYVFKSSFSAGPTVANEVLIQTNANTTLANLVKAINGTGTEGVEYSTGTLPATNITAGAVNTTAHTVLLSAKAAGVAGNLLVLTKTATHITVSGAGTLAGGTDADATMNNLIKAINGTGTAGVEYFAGTLAHPTISAGVLAAHAFTATAKTKGVAGNSLAIAEASTHLSWAGGATSLSGGLDDGVITTTAAQIKTILDANTPIAALVDIANFSGNDGTGVVTAMARNHLAGGSSGIVPLFTVTGPCLVSLRGYVEATLTGANATLVHGKTGTTNDLITILTGTNILIGGGVDSTGYVARGTGLAKTPLKLYNDGETIFATVATASVSGGKINYIADYIALSESAGVS